MSRLKLTKHQKALASIIEEAGGSITAIRTGGSHIKLDYTFDGHHFFTQHVPYGSSVDKRWTDNFRATVKRTKRQLSEGTQP